VQTIVSREIAPISSAVLTIGKIQGGTARNIIASSVELQASVRTLEAETADKVQAAVRRILEGLKTGMRIDYDARMDQAHAGAAQSQADDGAGARRRAQHARARERVEMPAPTMGKRGLRVVRRAGALRAPAHRLEDRGPRDGDPLAPINQLNRSGDPARDQLMSRAVLEFLG
jgi:acetylornithine deacetylase/succinyl-diaminopimelate desuccinylase-like protein